MGQYIQMSNVSGLCHVNANSPDIRNPRIQPSVNAAGIISSGPLALLLPTARATS